MKKVSLLTLLSMTAAASTAIAQAPVSNPCPCPKAFQGFFLGGNIGYGIGSGKGTLTDNTANATVLTNNLSVQGVDGGLNVGYTHRFNNFGLGLEGVFNWASASGKTTLRVDDYSVKRQLNNTIQVRGNFSYVICNLVAPKIILGWDNSQWERTVTDLDTPTAKDTNKKRLNGFVWGAGVDFLLAKHVIAGVEYTGVTYGNQSSTSTLDGSSITAKDSSTVYNRFTATVKFIY